MKILPPETDVPYVDAEQMVEVDRATIEDYCIDLTQMMENAGRCLATLARDCFLHGMTRELIEWANASGAPILALDTPSGIDATTGTVFDPAIKAAATLTPALPKKGLRAPGVEAYVGKLYLADISVPPELYREPALGLKVGNIFASSDVVRLW